MDDNFITESMESMEEEESSIYVLRKQFGYSEISWEIENYFSATCKEDWIIHSPDFSMNGLQVTRWRLSLKGRRIEGKRVVDTYLERLETDPFPDAVRAKCRLSYPTGQAEHVVSEVSCVFERNTVAKRNVLGLDQLEEHMKTISCRTFTVRCLLMVYNSDGIKPDNPKDLGLKYLSQDLAVLCRVAKSYYYDVILFVGENVRAHKTILGTRNSVLESMIEDTGNIIELDFSWVKPEVVQDLISFLYTGNLYYVNRAPSITMHDLINYLKVDELKSYYKTDELTLRTRFGMREFNFIWIIKKMNSSEEQYRSSPHWRLDILNTTLQLSLHLTRFDKESDNWAILAQFVKGEKPKEAYFEFEILDANSKPHGLKCLYWTSEKNEKMGFENFISKDILNSFSFVTHGNLEITCKLRIPTGTQSQSVMSSETCSLVSDKKNPHYAKLVKDLEDLFESGRYSDLTIHTNVFRFKVHKAILSSRSYVFSRMIADAQEESSVRITDVDANTLKIVLLYVYTGTLKIYNDPERIKKVYAAANKFSLLPLKYACSKILQDNINLQNAFEILVLASKGKDLKLKISVFNFICHNIDEIQLQTNWPIYINEDSNISKEFAKFMKRFIELHHREKIIQSGHSTVEDFIKNYKSANNSG